MSTKIGLWMDHRKAVIVMVTASGEQITQILSNAEKQLRRTGDSPLQGDFESQLVPADDSRQRTLTAQLNTYYDEIIACVREAESLLIFGPGAAKGELQNRLEAEHLGDRVSKIETADDMTDPQIASKVRQYFAH